MDYQNLIMGQRIKKLRKDRNLKQDDLGEILGLSRPQISNIENNKRGISLKNLKTISEYFGVSLETLGFNDKMIETQEVIERTKLIFANDAISMNEKEELFEQVIRMYLAAKDQKNM